MNIVMVAGHACIRVQKMAVPLIEKGHNVHLVAMKIPSFHEQYKTFTYCNDVGQMLDALKLYDKGADADVFHCHNEPSWFVTALKEITKKPVILDVHDSYLARSTPDEATKALDSGEMHVRVSAEERNNFQIADGLVYPGRHFSEVVSSEFKLEQPSLVLPSYVPERFYMYSGRDWHGGLVYEGKVNLPSETTGVNKGFEYCDYTELSRQAKALDMDFHLYAARKDEKFTKHYGEYAFIHSPVVYEELMKNLTRHDWGLVGNVTKTREWEVAMPNKMFEYMAAGIPVVSMNAGECSKFIAENDVGITVSNPEELAGRWKEHREKRKNVIAVRKNWSMNAHINKLEKFYEDVRAGCS